MELNKVDLGGLVFSLEKYNEQFGLGRMMSSFLLGFIRIADDDVDAVPDREGFETNVGVQKQISRGHLEQEFGELLDTTGLSLEPVYGGAKMLIGSEGVETTKMRINLKDGKAFVTYLRSLDEATISDSQVRGVVFLWLNGF